MDLMPWLLIIQLWTDPPPKIKFIYSKEYPNYEACMTARQEWIDRNRPPADYQVMCSVKLPKEKK